MKLLIKTLAGIGIGFYEALYMVLLSRWLILPCFGISINYAQAITIVYVIAFVKFLVIDIKERDVPENEDWNFKITIAKIVGITILIPLTWLISLIVL